MLIEAQTDIYFIPKIKSEPFTVSSSKVNEIGVVVMPGAAELIVIIRTADLVVVLGVAEFMVVIGTVVSG